MAAVLEHLHHIDYRSGQGLDRAVFGDTLMCNWIERRQNLLITGMRRG